MTATAVRNLAALHRTQAERYGDRIALRYKSGGLYHDVSWRRYRADALACAAALVEVGVRPGDRVGLLAENSVAWLVADMGLLAAGAVNVPPHAPLTASQIAFQLHDAGVSWLFVSSREQLDKVRQVRGDLPNLRGVVVFDPSAAADDATSWRGFLQAGRRALPKCSAELADRESALGPDDLATIMYTSGTTGNPKGVMLTHGNLQTNADAVAASGGANAADVLLSWLPYSHIYARTCDHYMQLACGMTVCLAISQETLVENLAETQPTRFTSVPRFYEKLYAAVASSDAEQTKKRLRNLFGARIRVLTSGGAPLPRAVAEAYHAAGLMLLQGYGLTESAPVISFNRPTSYKIETVGQAVPGVEIRIADDGEVLTRGPHVMRGYWNNPAATADAIRDGWLHTGDLGALDGDGFLSITGRKKELLVLSSGKKVVPSQVEGRLIADPLFDQAVVYGEGRSFLTALLVPNVENLKRAMKEAGTPVDTLSADELAKDVKATALVEARVAAALGELSPWERVKKFVLLPTPFSVAADEMTVSLKLRRNVIFEHHRAALAALYHEAAHGERGA